MQMLTAVYVEWLKLRRSRIFYTSIVVALGFPLLIGFVMTSSAGMDGAIVLPQNAPAYMMQYDIVIAIGGLLGFGFLFSWLFGREYSDGTVTDLLALPVSRMNIIGAKFVIGVLWCVLLAAMHFAAGTVFLWNVFPDTMTASLAWVSLAKYSFVCAMVIGLSAPVAFIATVGRGYLAPLAFVVLMIVIAQLLGAVGRASYFPWAVPGLISGVAGDEAMHLNIVSIMLPFAVGIAGTEATVLWWRYADQT